MDSLNNHKVAKIVLAAFIAFVVNAARAEGPDANSGFLGGVWKKVRTGVGSVVKSSFKEGEIQYKAVEVDERQNLVRLAKCANAAYREVEIPEGYVAFSGSDWDSLVLGRHYPGCKYDENGYVDLGSGMRARIMFEKRTGDIVVAYSGCDILENASAGAKDVATVAKHWWGTVNGQYGQALDIFNGLLLSYPSRKFEVVGHSLGGGLATFVVAACNDSDERVTGATFNGLGLSKAICKKYITPWREERAAKFIVNVKGSSDPVFVINGKHFGRVYNIEYDTLMCDPHSLDELIVQMRKR